MLANLDIWQLLGGLGLFLFSMGQIESALGNIANKSFKNFLIRNTSTPLRSIASGGITTAMLQSSSLVGLLVLAFTGAGLISLNSALGVIIGSNLGTTLTGWIVATIGFKFKIDSFALPLIAIGGLISVFAKGHKYEIGRVFVAIGLILLGLEFMKDSVSGIQDQFNLDTLIDFSSWQYVLFGTIFAAILQSSSATIIIALAALDGGIITLPSAAAIAIGADLGTTSTLVLGATNGRPNTKRVATAHVIFNLVTDVIAFILLTQLLSLIALIGITNPLYSLVAFHTLFNLLGILLFLPCLNLLAKFLEKLFVQKKIVLARYTNQITADVSSAAIIAIRKDVSYLLQRVFYQNRMGFQPNLTVPAGTLPIDDILESEFESSENFKQLYHASKLLEGEILVFATDLQVQSLEPQESIELSKLLDVMRNALHASKNIKDIKEDLINFELSRKPAIKDFTQKLHELMNNFYSVLYSLKADKSNKVLPEELQILNTQVKAWHSDLHKFIISMVHDRQIADTEASSMLNVNREILNSNQSVISCLSDYHETLILDK